METQIIGFCADSIPKLFGIFDLSIAPLLLYYSYIPVIIITGFFSLFMITFEKASVFSKIFFGLSLSFILWVLNILVQWIGVPHALIYHSWQLTALFEILIPILTILLMYAYLRRVKIIEKIPRTVWGVLGTIFLITVFLIPTQFNISAYDFENCEGFIGPLWYFIYGFEIVSLFWLLILTLRNFFNKNINKLIKRPLLLIGIGMIIFLGFFSVANIYGEITQQYTLNLVGPIGMVIFLALIVFLTIKYQMLRMKLFATQILVYTSLTLILSLLFINDLTIIHVVTAITGILFLGMGVILVRSVRRETEERLHLEQLTLQLEDANEKLKVLDESKNEFLSFATHQLRSPLTSIKWGLNAVFDQIKDNSSYEESKKIVTHLESTTDDLVSTVNDLLDISKIEQGGLVIKEEDFDLYDMTARLVEEFKMTANKKGLELQLKGDHQSCIMRGDQTKLRQVFVNLIDNAVKYTPKGSIIVTFKKSIKTAHIQVTDTGPGMSSEEVKQLFDKFLRGVAGKASTGGSGLGLYLAKKIIEIHHGIIKAESPGVGKGSTFSIDLPILS